MVNTKASMLSKPLVLSAANQLIASIIFVFMLSQVTELTTHLPEPEIPQIFMIAGGTITYSPQLEISTLMINDSLWNKLILMELKGEWTMKLMACLPTMTDYCNINLEFSCNHHDVGASILQLNITKLHDGLINRPCGIGLSMFESQGTVVSISS